MYQYFKTQLNSLVNKKSNLRPKLLKILIDQSNNYRGRLFKGQLLPKTEVFKKGYDWLLIAFEENKQRPLDSLLLSKHMFFLSNKYIEQVKQQAELEFNCKCFFEVQMKQHS